MVGHAPSLGYDNIDGGIGRLHTNFEISGTLSKKVLIFVPKMHFSTFLFSSKIFFWVLPNVTLRCIKEHIQSAMC